MLKASQAAELLGISARKEKRSHSLECLAELAAAIAGGVFVQKALAQPEQNHMEDNLTMVQPEQEPVEFEAWLAKQHGDPEEIGFLQALRIAYVAGQDSTTINPKLRDLILSLQMLELIDEVSLNKFISKE